MISLKSDREISAMRKVGRIAARVRDELMKNSLPGVSTWDLDRLAESKAKELGAKCAFKGYAGFPSHVCLSRNEKVVHGIPAKDEVLEEGDVLSIDFGALKDGYYGDTAVTVAVGACEPRVESLVETCKESLRRGIEQFQEGNYLGDISHEVQNTVESEGFYVVKGYVGHGIGKSLHEEPQVPNFGPKGKGSTLR